MRVGQWKYLFKALSHTVKGCFPTLCKLDVITQLQFDAAVDVARELLTAIIEYRTPTGSCRNT